MNTPLIEPHQIIPILYHDSRSLTEEENDKRMYFALLSNNNVAYAKLYMQLGHFPIKFNVLYINLL